MKILTSIISLLLILVFSCKNVPEIHSQNNVGYSEDFHTFLNGDKPTYISAHRGGSGIQDYAENSLETIAYLYDKDIKIFEIDIIQTADDELMLLHDDHLERTTSGHGTIKGLTSKDLLKVRLVDDFGNETPYKIPFLIDVLKWTKGKEAYLMIDFKPSVGYQKVISTIRDEGLEKQCILISYNMQQANKLHSLAPDMLLSVSARNEEELGWLLNSNIPTKNMIAFTGTRLSDQILYNKLKELKIPSILGTLGNLDKKAAAKDDKLYKEWSDMGIQIFATDRPLDAYKAIQ